ncbi:MAG TPA: NAD(P)/FAD-dependent oxidoreductase [Streptosporangiaceae bacterium]|nr:NAD(P)/FAD-dependent oxidoreductase [Streptosporangiaceae bacterium]
MEDEVRDVVVVGGGAAGLSAGLMLARARRRVTVVDAGAPRNAPAEGVHALLGLDGVSPAELLARGRAEVTGYGGEVITGEVGDVSPAPEGFTIKMMNGDGLHARRLLIATGLVDELPEIPGLRERWGREVVHCPYCHGWEVRDRLIGVLATGPMSVRQALLFRQWTGSLRYFSNGRETSAEEEAKLAAAGIPVISGRVTRLEAGGEHALGVCMDDGRVVEVDVVAVASRMVARAGAFSGIGIETAEHPMGSYIAVDQTGRTAVPGVWVAGNATDLSAQVSAASADGARVAAQINADLVVEDTDRAVARLAQAVAAR